MLHVFFGLSTGGIERLITDLAVGLPAPPFRISVATYHGGPFTSVIRGAGTEVMMLGAPDFCSRVARMSAHVRRLRALLSSPFDIVHTHSLGILWRVLLASSPRRTWHWIHTEHVRVDVPDLYTQGLLRLAPFLLRRPDVVTGVSDSVCDYLLNVAKVSPSRVHRVPNGVDVRRFADANDRSVVRRRLRIPDDAWLLGTVANLRPQKNHVALLRALARVRRTVPRAHAVLVGEGPLLPILQRHARSLGVEPFVHFLGARTDVAEILGALDTYCLPSRFEGMPISILEAMAAGCPIVATQVPGTVDLIEHERTGLLVPLDNIEALARQIVRLHDDGGLRARLRRAGRIHVTLHFASDVMLRRYWRLYTAI